MEEPNFINLTDYADIPEKFPFKEGFHTEVDHSQESEHQKGDEGLDEQEFKKAA